MSMGSGPHEQAQGIRRPRLQGGCPVAQGWESLEPRRLVCCPRPQAGRCRPGSGSSQTEASLRRDPGEGGVWRSSPGATP